MRIRLQYAALVITIFLVNVINTYSAHKYPSSQNDRLTIIVSSSEELETILEKSSDYDTIAIKNGVYNNFKIEIPQSGSKKKPLILKAQNPGEVIFNRGTAFILKGSHIVLSGFYFKADLSSNGMDGGQPVIDIKGDYNRITQCAFWKCHNRASIASLYQQEEDRMPKYTRIDHCYFADNFGWRLYLDLGQRVPGDDLKYAMHYRIDHNYFSTPFKFGANTGSAMRIGLGPLGYGRCLIDNNLFERQNGEVELIENKSHENVYIHNTFKNCESQMSFRQGHRTIFLHNALLGTDPDKKCGGLGMWMDNHLVAGNYFSFPHGSYVPLNANMKIREERLPAAVIGFKSGCKNFMENGEPVGHFASQDVIFANNLLFNNKDLLIDFSQGLDIMKKRYEEKLGINVSGSFNHQIINNFFVSLDDNKVFIFEDKANQAIQTSYIANNKCEGYKKLDKGANTTNESIPFADVSTFNQWLALIPGLDSQIDLVSLANSSVAEISAEPNQEMKVLFKKKPLNFEDVGPDWLKENPSDFARNGKMTNSLKKQIKSLMAK
jgi:poly(beta-D-mannuronate) lyase